MAISSGGFLGFFLGRTLWCARKITEPKTPYVQYDALNDMVLSGPSLLPVPLFLASLLFPLIR